MRDDNSFSIPNVKKVLKKKGYTLENRENIDIDKYSYHKLKDIELLLFKRQKDTINIYFIEYVDAFSAITEQAAALERNIKKDIRYYKSGTGGNINITVFSNNDNKEKVDEVFNVIINNEVY
jgi:hypothetical protein